MEDKTIKLLMLIPIYILVATLLVFAYNTWQNQKEIKGNYCYACGMYQAKQCFQLYPDAETYNDKDKLKLWLTNIAEGNAKVETKIDSSYLQIDNNKLNFTIPN
jgi:hypothetical protein